MNLRSYSDPQTPSPGGTLLGMISPSPALLEQVSSTEEVLLTTVLAWLNCIDAYKQIQQVKLLSQFGFYLCNRDKWDLKLSV